MKNIFELAHSIKNGQAMPKIVASHTENEQHYDRISQEEALLNAQKYVLMTQDR